MDNRHTTLADALEGEVLTEMAGTFFGARKALEDAQEDFQLHVEDIRSREAQVFSRVFYLRSLLLGEQGETAFFTEIGLDRSFPASKGRPGSRTWHPDALPFAFLPGTRYVKAVLQAYGELRQACEAYMSGVYEEDPERSGRKRLSPHYRQLERYCVRLNERIAKVNNEMTPSSVLQYARSINSPVQSGQEALENSLGAESLDSGLAFKPVDFASLGLWEAPGLPPLEACEGAIRRFCSGFYKRNAPQIKKVLADLD